MLSIDQGTAAVKNAKRRVARVAAGPSPVQTTHMGSSPWRAALPAITLYLNYLTLKQFV
jgi:hypothetical protein